MNTLAPLLSVNLRLLILMLAGCLQACAVGIIKVEGPQLPQLQNPVSIDRDVYLEVCDPKRLAPGSGWDKLMRERIASVLQRDFNVQVHLGKPPADKPYFHFLFIENTDSHYFTSIMISFLTFGVIPGYGVEQTKIDIPLAARDADGKIIQDRFKYEYRDRAFLWLPLIIYPDVVASINGGYTNKRKEEQGLEMVLHRFMFDASETMRQQSAKAQTGDALPELKCPDE